MAMRTYVRAVVRDRSRKVIRDTGWRRTNTLVSNFFAAMRALLAASDTSVVEVGGTTFTLKGACPASGPYMNALADAGVDGYGLVVGTGTKSPTRDDYKLESKIPHGTGSGRLTYGGSDVFYGDDYVEVRRSFGNSSGADITINEVGIVVQYYPSGGSEHLFLIARSLFTVTIPDGGSATLYYRIQG